MSSNMNTNKELDLDINNYDLEDILKLFKIPVNFNENHLKTAKKIVLKTHPDKSGLDPDFFRFYSKAYKMVYSVWEFRKKGDIDKEKLKNTEYSSYDEQSEKRELLNQLFDKNEKLKNSNQFNKWFNEQFERNRIYNENQEKGYENWLRSSKNPDDDDNDNINNKKITMETMVHEFEKKNQEPGPLLLRKT